MHIRICGFYFGSDRIEPCILLPNAPLTNVELETDQKRNVQVQTLYKNTQE
jgi:hypothetical protein